MEKYFAFQWHITDECDQRCKHCYIFADRDVQIQRMSFDKIQWVYDNTLEMCRQMKRTPYFYITGGDPILHHNFWDMLDMFKAHNIAFGILGNPFHLDKELCERLREAGCGKYQMSLDGLRETHDLIRKPGSFDQTMEKIKCIRDAGMTSVIMTTVSSMNIDEIPRLIDLVILHEVDVFAFSRYCPSASPQNTHVTPDRYRNFLEICWDKFSLYKDLNTTFSLKDHLWTLFLYEKGLFTIPADLDPNTIYDGCNCGNCHMTILPDGNVYACRRMESRIGNAFSERLSDIFLSDRMKDFTCYDKFEKCAKCELLRFCRGCPAVAYSYTGNAYSADPQCWKKL